MTRNQIRTIESNYMATGERIELLRCQRPSKSPRWIIFNATRQNTIDDVFLRLKDARSAYQKLMVGTDYAQLQLQRSRSRSRSSHAGTH